MGRKRGEKIQYNKSYFLVFCLVGYEEVKIGWEPVSFRRVGKGYYCFLTDERSTRYSASFSGYCDGSFAGSQSYVLPHPCADSEKVARSGEVLTRTRSGFSRTGGNLLLDDGNLI